MFVPILLGSKVDKPHGEKIAEILETFGIKTQIIVASAHKVPERVLKVLEENEGKDHVCYITGAGRSNALSGFVSANTSHPVIACPPFSDKADMMVNIHSTLQMPSDTPAMVVVDPQNAAMAALRILAGANPELRQKVQAHIQSIKDAFTHE